MMWETTFGRCYILYNVFQGENFFHDKKMEEKQILNYYELYIVIKIS